MKVENRLELNALNFLIEILVIPNHMDSSYLIKKDGSTRIPAKIKGGTNDQFSSGVTHALVEGQLFIFGGWTDEKMVKSRFIRSREKI